MKYCVECGSKMKNESEFCYRCGAPYPLEGDESLYMERRAAFRQNKRDSERKAQRKRRGHIVRATILGIILIALVSYLWISPARRASAMATAGKIEEADALYEKSVKGNPVERFLVRLLVPKAADSVCDAYNKGSLAYSDAYARIQELMKIEEPGTHAAKTAQKLDDLNISKSAWEEAQAYAEAGDMKNAMLAYRKVAEGDVNYDAARQNAADCEDAYKNLVLDTAGTPVTNEEYEKAIAYLEAAVEVLPESTLLSDKLESLRMEYGQKLKKDTVDKARSYIDSHNYAEAIGLINSALAYNENDSDLEALLAEAKKGYEDFARGEVSVYLEAGDIEGAQQYLAKVAEVIPDSTAIQQLITSVAEAAASAVPTPAPEDSGN